KSGIAYDPDHDWMWLTNSWTDRIGAIDLANDYQEVRNFRPVGSPMSAAWLDGVLFNIPENTYHVRRYNSNGDQLSNMQFPSQVDAITCSPQNHWLIVLEFHGTIIRGYRIDGEDFEEQWYFDFGTDDINLNSINAIVWVDDHLGGHLWAGAGEHYWQLRPNLENRTFEIVQHLDWEGRNYRLGLGHDGENLWLGRVELEDYVIINDNTTESSWIFLNQLSGLVEPEESTDLILTIGRDDIDLEFGDYEADLHVLSNDPNNEEIVVNVQMHLDEVPVIFTDHEIVDFGEVMVTAIRESSITIGNGGFDDLVIENISVEGDQFSTDFDGQFTLGRNESSELTVIFDADQVGVIEGVLTIVSNDPDNNEFEISLSGIGLELDDNRPVIAVDPLEIIAEGEGEQNLSISNDGNIDLEWETNIVSVADPERDLRGRNVRNVSKGSAPHRDELGDELGRFGFQSEYKSGIAWDPDNEWMWLTHRNHGTVRAIDVNDFFTEVVSFDGTNPTSAAWIDGTLHYLVDQRAYLIRHNSEGDRLSTLYFPALINSMTCSRENNWIITLGYHDSIIRAYTVHGDEVEEQWNFNLRQNGINGASAIVWVDEHKSGQLWIGSGDYYYQLNPDIEEGTFEIAQQFEYDGDNYQLGLGHDGENLWLGRLELDDYLIVDDNISESRWFGVYPTEGVIEADGNTNMTLEFGGYELIAGSYEADLHILSNDPIRNDVVVNVQLRYDDNPEIVVEPETLNFEPLKIFESNSIDFTIYNEGNSVLTISDISVDGNNFRTNFNGEFSLGSYSNRIITAFFEPEEVGQLEASIVITSSDGDHAEYIINLSGTGLDYPAMVVEADNISTRITSEHTLTISNDGETDLEWETDLEIINDPGQDRGRRGVRNTNGGAPRRDSLGDIIGRASWQRVESGDTKGGIAWDSDRNWMWLTSEWGRRYVGAIDLDNNYQEVAFFEENLRPTKATFLNDVLYYAYNAGQDHRSFLGRCDAEGNRMGVLHFPYVPDGITCSRENNWLIVSNYDDSILRAYTVNGDNIEEQWQIPVRDYIGGSSFLWVDDHLNGHLWAGDQDCFNQYDIDIQNRSLELVQRLEWEGRNFWAGLGHDGENLWLGFGEEEDYIIVDDDITESAWISIDPVSGIVPPQESSEMTIYLGRDDINLEFGDYEADLHILSNDPENEEVVLNIQLQLANAPVIVTDPETVNFGEVMITAGREQTLTISNRGFSNLEIENITVDGDQFSTDFNGQFQIGRNENTDLTVFFEPDQVGEIAGSLLITSNDPEDGELTVNLTGVCTELDENRPILSIDPLEISVRIGGEHTITMTNEGESDIEWEADIEAISEPERDLRHRNVRNIHAGSGGAPRRDELGGEIHRVPSRQQNKAGIAWDSNHEWMWLTDRSRIYAIDPANYYSEVVSFDGTNPMSAAWMNNSIYYQVNQHQWIIQKDIEGNTLNEISFPATIRAMTCSRANGWIINLGYHDSMIRGYTINGDDREEQWSFNIRQNGINSINSILWVDEHSFGHMWVCGGDDYYQIRPDLEEGTFEVLQHFVYDGDNYQLGIGHDGENLWLGRYELEYYLIVDDNVPESRWFAFDPYEGTIGANESTEMNVLIGGFELIAGEYEANIHLLSNDPINNDIVINLQFSISDTPIIVVEPETLEFDPLKVEESNSTELIILNRGSSDLAISDITTAGNHFTSDFEGEFTIESYESSILTVTFNPHEVGLVEDVLTFFSNDEENPEFTVNLTGIGLDYPGIVVDPLEIATETIGQHAITISNEGETDLLWDTDLEIISEPDQDRKQRSVRSTNRRAPQRDALGDVIEHVGWDRIGVRDYKMGVAYDPDHNWMWLTNKWQRYVSAIDLDNNYQEVVFLETDFRASCAAWLNDVFYYSYDGGQDHRRGMGRCDGNGNDLGELEFPFIPYGLTCSRENNWLIVSNYDDSILRAFTVDGDNLEEQWQIPIRGYVRGNSFLWVDEHRSGNLWIGDDGRVDQYSVDIEQGTLELVQRMEFDGANSFTGLGHDGENLWLGNYMAEDYVIVDDNITETDWLLLDPLSGTVSPEENTELTVSIGSNDMAFGEYEAELHITSNDPENADVVVSIQLTIEEAALIVVQPEALDFGSIFVNATGEQSITISNEGFSDLIIENIAIDGDEFSTNFDGEVVIASNNNAELAVTFEPSEPGNFERTLTIFSNAGNVPEMSIGLTGIGLGPPVITIDPDNITAVESGDHPITITNAGGNDLEWSAEVVVLEQDRDEIIRSIRNTSERNAPYRDNRGDPDDMGWEWRDNLEDDGPEFEWVDVRELEGNREFRMGDDQNTGALQLGWTYTFWDREFQTIYANTDAWASFTYTGNGYNISPTDYPLAANGNARNANFINMIQIDHTAGTEVWFWTNERDLARIMWAGNHNRWFELALHSNGLAVMQYGEGVAARACGVNLGDGQHGWYFGNQIANGRAIAFGPAGAWEHSWISINPDEGVLEPEASSELIVTLDDSDLDNGIHEAEIIIVSNDPENGEIVIPVEFEIGNTPVIILNQEDINFDEVVIGETGTRILSISNGGGVDLIVNNISIDGAYFGVGFEEAFTIAGDQSVEVTIEFTPEEIGDQVGTLTINSNDPINDEVTVNLTGRCIPIPAPIISVEPEFIDFGGVALNEIGDEIIVINNIGNANLIVTDVSVVGDGFSTPFNGEVSVPPNERFDLAILFNPPHGGECAGTLTITSNDNNNAEVTAELGGTGLIPPVIVIDPEEILAFESGEYPLTIGNEGGLDLEWSTSVAEIEQERDLSNRSVRGTMNPNIPQRDNRGDPDDMDWEWRDNLEDDGPEFEWIDVRELDGVRTFNMGDDQNTGALELGWTYTFWDREFQTIYANTDAWASFTYSGNGYSISPAGYPLAANGNVRNANFINFMQIDHTRGTDVWFWTNEQDLARIMWSGNHETWFELALHGNGMAVMQYSEGVAARPCGVNLGDGQHGWYFGNQIENGRAIAFGPSQVFGNVVNWISVDPSDGNIAPNESMEMTVILNADELEDGIYEAEVSIISNDPENGEVIIPIEFDLGQFPAISLDNRSIDFGQVDLEETGVEILTISNAGNVDLIVSDISVEGEFFEIEFNGEFTVSPNESVEIDVSFSPDQDGNYDGVITISSNDPNDHEVQVTITGTGVGPEVEELGQLGTPGQPQDIAVEGDYAYVPDVGGNDGENSPGRDDFIGTSLRVISIADPGNPVEVGFVEIEESANGIAVSGDYAYIAAYESGLRIIDIRNPQNPQEVSCFNTPGSANGVAVSGNYAYVADMESGLRIIDVSNPENPEEAGNCDTPVSAFNVFVAGDIAYIADLQGGLRVIDVSNPDNPEEVGVFNEGEMNILDVTVSRHFAYLADFAGGLRIIDVNNPENPVEVGFYEVAEASRIDVCGDHAYVADAGSGLHIIFIGDPEHPEEAGFYDTGGSVLGVIISGDVAYVADGENGIVILDVGDFVEERPFISVNPDVLEFGNVNINESHELAFAISNEGNADLTVTEVVVEGEHFTTDFEGEISIVPNEFSEILVSFDPGNMGDHMGSLTIISNDPDLGEVIIELSGIGIAPTIGVDPLEVISENGGDYLATVSNTGNVDLIWNSELELVNEPGNDAPERRVRSIASHLGNHLMRDDEIDWMTTEPIEGIIAPDGFEEITISLNAEGLEIGDYEANVHILSNDPENEDVIVSVVLEVVAPIITFNTELLDFDQVNVGERSGQSLIITNVGNQNLSILNIVVEGDYFYLQFDEELALMPDESVEICVNFAPESPGEFEGELIVFSSDPDHEITIVTLLGTGVGEPSISVDPENLDFDGVSLGESSNLSLNISNIGNLPLTVSDIVVEGFFTTDFEAEFTLQPNESTDVVVIFTPEEPGRFETNLVIISDDPLAGRLDVVVFGIGLNDAPEIINPIDDINLDEDSGFFEIVDLDDVFEDPNGDELTFSFEGAAELNIDLTEENVLTIDPDANFNGENIEVIIIADDGWDEEQINLVNGPARLGVSQYRATEHRSVRSVWKSAPDINRDSIVDLSFMVTVNPVNDAPEVIQNIDDVLLEEDAGHFDIVDLDDIFFDVDFDMLEYQFRGVPEELNLTIDEDNVISINTEENFNIEDGIEIVVSAADVSDAFAIESFIIIVTPINDVPFVVNEIENISVDQGIGRLEVADLSEVFFDVDQDDNLNFQIQGAPEELNMAVDEDDILFFNADNDFTLPDGVDITIIATDDSAETAENTFNLIITPAGQERELVVELSQNWNLMSINVVPDEEFWAREEGPDVIRMLAQFIVDDENHVLLFKDEDGLFYLPAFNFNNLPYWNLTEGYQIKLDQDFDAVWSGEPIPPDTDIPLEENWNFVAYFPTYELDASGPDFHVLSPILDNLVTAKNGDGLFMLPAFEFSNMVPWCEGQGYQIRVDADVVLNYPPPQEEVQFQSENSSTSVKSHHWSEPKRTGSNMSVLILPADGMDMKAGDQIGAFNSKGRLVGFGKFNVSDYCGLAVWGDDKSTEMIDGLLVDETFILRLWNNDTGIESDLELVVSKQGLGMIYSTDEFSVMEVQFKPEIPDNYFLSKAYPNPFNAKTNISYSLPVASHVTIRIVDISGRLVKTLVSNFQPAGKHATVWDSEGKSSGVYMIQMQSTDFSASRKVVLMR
ncbi:MAG: choice-of-anchor D domain-containing protein, partial [Calditrichaeota bacterium]|nr:choice-of-anchor D domain-containing protein [Calditrichota bacterium]